MKLFRDLLAAFNQIIPTFKAWADELDQRNKSGEFGKYPWQKDYGLWPWQRKRRS